MSIEMYSKTHPYLAKVKDRYLLSGPGSSKKTYHVVLQVEHDALPFQVGDSIAVFPTNHIPTVDQILHKLGRAGSEEIFDTRSNKSYTFRDYLLHKANIHKVFFHKLFPVEKKALPLLEWVETHQPTPSQLCTVLLPLMPRFYSIASSPKVFPDEIHLTIASVQYLMNGQIQWGVGSHFLCEQAEMGSTSIPIYVQPSDHFTLPSDPTAPIILIGPGTGIAPFRAFLQERIATGAPGKNWLFFGERNRASDFYYEDFWTQLEREEKVRLDLAFSRDQPEKMYVQHKMLEQKKALWQWIQSGSYLYVCGDAQEMAKDVEKTLQQIIHEEGQMPEEDARQFLKALRKSHRYLLDVY